MCSPPSPALLSYPSSEQGLLSQEPWLLWPWLLWPWLLWEAQAATAKPCLPWGQPVGAESPEWVLSLPSGC